MSLASRIVRLAYTLVALDILAMEAKDGMLDADLLSAFVEARVFESVMGEWRLTPSRMPVLTG